MEGTWLLLDEPPSPLPDGPGSMMLGAGVEGVVVDDSVPRLDATGAVFSALGSMMLGAGVEIETSEDSDIEACVVFSTPGSIILGVGMTGVLASSSID